MILPLNNLQKNIGLSVLFPHMIQGEQYYCPISDDGGLSRFSIIFIFYICPVVHFIIFTELNSPINRQLWFLR